MRSPFRTGQMKFRYQPLRGRIGRATFAAYGHQCNDNPGTTQSRNVNASDQTIPPSPALATDRVTAHFCLHCGETLVGKYCHGCGMQAAGDRVTIRTVISETFRQISKLDSALVRTFITLIRHPAEVTIAYLVGQRAQFVSPIRYMVVLLGTEFALTAVLKWCAHWLGHDAAIVWLDHSGRGYLLRFVQVYVLASFWRGLFRSSGYNLAEMYVMGLYVYAQITALNIAMNMLVVAIPFFPKLGWMEGLALMSAIDFAYLLFAAKGFFGEGWAKTSTKLLLSYVLPLVLFWGAIRLFKL